jgi:hypothetical protein
MTISVLLLAAALLLSTAEAGHASVQSKQPSSFLTDSDAHAAAIRLFHHLERTGKVVEYQNSAAITSLLMQTSFFNFPSLGYLYSSSIICDADQARLMGIKTRLINSLPGSLELAMNALAYSRAMMSVSMCGLVRGVALYFPLLHSHISVASLFFPAGPCSPSRCVNAGTSPSGRRNSRRR